MNSKKQKREQQSFLYATLILGISTVLVKALGAFFRIPLAGLIGASGMGYFSTAYDVYLPIYSLAMAGLPVAVSRIVASKIAEKRYRDARRALTVAKRTFMVTGLVGFLLMFLVAVIVSYVANNPGARPSMYIIAPSILFCCVMSAYRGYYEGVRNMFPTAISSLIEAVCKLVLGYGFAYIVMQKFTGSAQQKASYAAAAAMLGITIGTALGALFLKIRHKRIGDGITKQDLALSPDPDTGMAIFKALVYFAIPVALGSLVNNVASMVDVVMVQRQLKHAVEASPQTFHNLYGKYLTNTDGTNISDSEIPNFLYGCYKGYAYTIFNLIPTITSVVGVSALPVLTMAWTSRNKTEIKSNIESMVKVITLIAFPAGIGVTALAPQIISLLYKSPEAAISNNILAILGIAACFAGMTTPLTNLLQAIERPSVPVKNIAVGCLIKIAVNYILVGSPKINILGAAIGTVCCYLYIAVADVFCLVKYSHVVPNLYACIIKPLFAALCCGAAAYIVNAVAGNIISNGKITAILAILCAVVVYVIAVSVFRCIEKKDLLTLPKGDKIANVFAKLHIIR